MPDLWERVQRFYLDELESETLVQKVVEWENKSFSSSGED